MKKNKKSQITIFIVFIIVTIILLMIVAVIAPMGVTFTTKMYEAGENMMLLANESISNINDETIRTQIQASIDEGLAAQQTNIDVYSDIYQYGWIISLVLIGLIIFLYTRRLVEYGGAGGFV